MTIDRPNERTPTRRVSRRMAIATPVALTALASLGTPLAKGDDHPSSEIKHVVAFRYRPEVTAEQRTEVLNRFLALQDQCLRDGQRYVVSIVGGDCTRSLEGLTGGFEQVFIVTFSSRADYEYYIGRPFTYPFDPVHDAFKAYSTPLLAVDSVGQTNGALVLDFPT
ncbi:Dabb family protein [Mycobacterium sp. RTGN5]|uniref:Dabb family protein n=1 Tax=Mycobacterium sp. RTGN5 TaxID=3016522 RepID=UPI0029C79422|nr:Dabb family protein [Mycobacterium sp. RTGN5]